MKRSKAKHNKMKYAYIVFSYVSNILLNGSVEFVILVTILSTSR